MPLPNLYSVGPGMGYKGPTYPTETQQPVHRPPPGTRVPQDPRGPYYPFPNSESSGKIAPQTSPNKPALQEWYNSENNYGRQFDDEMYDYFKGDDILKNIQVHDPNAKWVEGTMKRGDSDVRSRRLDFDVERMPKTKTPWGGEQGLWDGDMKSGYVKPFHNDTALDKNMYYDDPNYGRLTNSRNIKPDTKNWLDYVGQGAKMAAGIATGGLSNIPFYAGQISEARRTGQKIPWGQMAGQAALSYGGGQLMSGLGGMGGGMGNIAQAARYVQPAMSLANMYRNRGGN